MCLLPALQEKDRHWGTLQLSCLSSVQAIFSGVAAGVPYAHNSLLRKGLKNFFFVLSLILWILDV